jgi:hypothetical protein
MEPVSPVTTQDAEADRANRAVGAAEATGTPEADKVSALVAAAPPCDVVPVNWSAAVAADLVCGAAPSPRDRDVVEAATAAITGHGSESFQGSPSAHSDSPKPSVRDAVAVAAAPASMLAVRLSAAFAEAAIDVTTDAVADRSSELVAVAGA